jgi:hypothetical protein
MTRMSREFSLVLLGAGILTAGYFAAPSHEEELEKKAEEQAARQIGHNDTSRVRGMGLPLLLFLHSPGFAGTTSAKSPAMPHTNRGGFGGIGRSMGAGGS